MTTEQLPPPTTSSEQPWGAPQQRPPRRWSSRKTVAAVAIAVGVAAAGGAAIYAASSSSSSSSSAPGGPGGQLPGGMGGPGGSAGFALSSALRGEYVVSDGNGGYTTELMQIGEVTAVDATSLTAKSTDGYTRTYTIDSGTAVGDSGSISDIATGDTVTVVAKESGSTATADTVTEGSAQSGGPGGPGGGQQPDGLPARQDGSSGQGQG